ncbi:uncharacterized protein LOC121764816 isoform X2 [Salvia splendens]|uniref:uncharacterized protein LOC121764816 isoform X2 n=1 Tax=Salvia splendens TaxID=180675 RepID=UPI001C26766B|nr:uncharacterized protein LOC121764816 isoform X2 [Salvia splendens]
MAQSETLSRNGADDFDRMPLNQRLKLLFASHCISIDSELKSRQLQQTPFPAIRHSGRFKHEIDSENKCVKSSHVTAAGVYEKAASVVEIESPIEVKIEDGENNVDIKSNSEAEMRHEHLDELDHVFLKERLRRLLTSECLGLSSPMLKASCYLSGDSRIVQTPDIPSLANVKVEAPNPDDFKSSIASTVGQMSSSNFVPVKAEVHTAGDTLVDDLDHMLLRERMKLLSSRNAPSLNTPQSPISMSKMTHSASGCWLDRSKPTHSVKINRPRKRKKTATDSIETAMEEDAPGLLQVLIDKGVAVDEIKLYGEPESKDALDDSFMQDSFGELEEVITKLFSQRESLLKYGPVRCSKGERVSYCLECLFSLVEQAHYLQHRHWPVEWGWCRDLQSFIFVFERHNRIVLERPEYGYATYFFELVDSLPIAWQIKRLVTVMKLTSCSRTTLIENRALMVGDDLSEGEAKVLMEYGWIPNTGLGSMLNYYDRVFHDRRSEKDGSEWRSKRR